MSGLSAVAAELARAHLAAGRTLVTRAQGHSMWPLIRDGQRLEILPPPAAGPRVGQVVLTACHGRLVLHRVVVVRADGWVVTKGDAVAHRDGAVNPDAIMGVLPLRPWDPLVAGLSRCAGWLIAGPLARLRRAVSR